MSQALADRLEELLAEAGQYETCMALHVDEEGGAVELILDTGIATYGDWIEGEGPDICLLKCQETHRVVGCRLPLRTNKLVVAHHGPLKINDGFRKDDCEQHAATDGT